ncbi:recombinase family protein [Costertonia aggregata]|uniref:Recombinase family protein n=1 Tax=Costertonia aggregata TaxID=343403 RepID=A0A7H9ARI1_9FLAO|nr:recombinase family protein [Costertonia aggregata]QLG46026.1 recombinase family protein [Costertonia aggregata]
MRDIVAIYARISQEKDEVDVSIPQQIEQGKAFAKSKGMGYEIYFDEGYSGTLQARERPAMYKLLQDIVKKDSRIGILWGREMFRLYRGNTPKIEIQMVCKRHDVDIYYADKKLDNSDPLEKLMDNMLGVMGEFYVDLTKQNVKQAIKKNFEDGKAHGVAPYGYKTGEGKKLEIDEEQAKWVKKMFQWHIEGMGLTSITKKLTDLNVPTQYSEKHTRFSKKWDRTTVYAILMNKLYYGVRTHLKREIPVPELAIIDEATYNESLVAFEALKSYTGKRTWHKYLIIDLLYCAHCGERYIGRADNKNNHVYRCNSKRKGNCKNRDIRKSYIESFVWEYIREGGILLDNLLNSTDNQNEKRKKELEAEVSILENGMERLNGQSSNIIRLAVEGLLSDSDLAGEKKRIEREKIEYSVKIKNLKEQIGSIREEKDLKNEILKDFHKVTGKRYNDKLPHFKDFVKHREIQKNVLEENYPFNEKQQFLRKYINRILVDYTNGILKFTFNFKAPLSDRTVYMDRNFYVAVDADTKLMYDMGHPKQHNVFDNLKKLMHTITLMERKNEDGAQGLKKSAKVENNP